MTIEIAVAILGFGLIASLLLVFRAISSRSWQLMWGAALASLAVSAVSIFSIGALVFLITCLQLGASAAMRRQASAKEWVVTLVAATVVWVIVVPSQFIVPSWLPGLGILAVVGLLGMFVPLLPFSTPNAHHQ